MAKNNTNYKQKAEIYLDLLYMTPSEIMARDIAKLLTDTDTFKIQLWDDMNILELELSNGNSVDFEPLEPVFQNPSDAAFIKNRNIKTIFAISMNEADLPMITAFLTHIVDKYSGFVCGDTEDFRPVYIGSSKL